MKQIIGLLLAAACFAGGFWQATAQETLTVEYTLEGIEGVRHELQVDADEEVLKFENIPLTSLTLPEGLTELRELTVGKGSFIGKRMSLANLTLPEGLTKLEKLHVNYCELTNLTLPKGLVRLNWLALYGTPIASLKLPEDFGKKNVNLSWRGFRLDAGKYLERLSVHKTMKGFELDRYDSSGELIFPPARRLIRNRSPDSDGVYRIKASRRTINVGGNGVKLDSDGVYRIESRHPLLVEVYGFQPTFTITRKADGVEIGWEAGTLQRSLLIDGPWRDVESGGTERRLFFRPSHPYEFFRVKP